MKKQMPRYIQVAIDTSGLGTSKPQLQLLPFRHVTQRSRILHSVMSVGRVFVFSETLGKASAADIDGEEPNADDRLVLNPDLCHDLGMPPADISPSHQSRPLAVAECAWFTQAPWRRRHLISPPSSPNMQCPIVCVLCVFVGKPTSL